MAEFRLYGHNCFRIKAREATVITDPVDRVTGYAMPKQTADIVTISHEHQGHTNLDAIRPPEYQIVRGPGEYEMHDVFITGIRTYHDDAKGSERGYNTVYLIEVEGFVIVHLGDLGHPLSAEQAEALDDCDVLLVPAGGGDVVSPEQAAEIVSQLGPKVVIPMQYATADRRQEARKPRPLLQGARRRRPGAGGEARPPPQRPGAKRCASSSWRPRARRRSDDEPSAVSHQHQSWRMCVRTGRTRFGSGAALGVASVDVLDGVGRRGSGTAGSRKTEADG